MHRHLIVVLTTSVALLVAACSSEGPTPAPSAQPLGDRPSVAAPTSLPPLAPELDALPESEVTVVSLEGPQATVPVRVAAGGSAATLGLPGVSQLPDGVGVLVRFEDRAEPYEPETLGAPVDAVFVGGSLVVLDVLAAGPCEGDCAALDPGTRYVAVLLLPRDWLADNGFVEPLRVVLPDAT